MSTLTQYILTQIKRFVPKKLWLPLTAMIQKIIARPDLLKKFYQLLKRRKQDKAALDLPHKKL